VELLLYNVWVCLSPAAAEDDQIQFASPLIVLATFSAMGTIDSADVHLPQRPVYGALRRWPRLTTASRRHC